MPGTSPRSASRLAGAVLVAGLLALASPVSAPALTGATNVGADDIGARASVALSYRGGQVRCGGVVLPDGYVLTTAHCFTDGKGNMVRPAGGWEVSYWGGQGAKRETRRVERVTINENYLHEEKVAYPAPQPWDYTNFPIQHEDIAVLRISGAHPAEAIGAVIPPIVNPYTEKSRNSTWFYVYGAAANGSAWRLQRALVAVVGGLERVIPGEKPWIMYAVRKMIIGTTGIPGPDSFMKNISICSGDSGTGVFLVDAPAGMLYDDHPDEFPSAIALQDGHPILVGLMANATMKGLVTDVVKKRDGCGRDQGSDAMVATRVDYFHDWIMSKTGVGR
jgi:hypothetical protein